jgi:hypothetical protein
VSDSDSWAFQIHQTAAASLRRSHDAAAAATTGIIVIESESESRSESSTASGRSTKHDRDSARDPPDSARQTWCIRVRVAA